MEEHTNSCQKNFTVQGIKSQDLFQDFKTGYLRKLNNTRNIHYISIKFASLRNRKGAFFMLCNLQRNTERRLTASLLYTSINMNIQPKT